MEENEMPKIKNTAIKAYTTKKGEIRYMFKTYIGTDELTGKVHQVTRKGFKSQSEANEEFRRLRSEGVKPEINTTSTTMDELFELWFETYKHSVKESTAMKTKQMYIVHVRPVFGKSRIDKIAPAHIQQYMDKLSSDLIKYKTIYNYISRMYKYAISLNLVSSNPTANVIIPKRSDRGHRDTAHNFYNRDELNKFLNTAKTMNGFIYIYFYLLASTGLRKSEALALTWNDIDFKKKLIDVNKTLAYGFDNSLIVQEPKSKKSKRQVPMTDNLISELRIYKLANAKYNILFHTANGEYLRLSKPTQWLQRVYDSNPKLKKITTHGFRHTFASLLFESDPNIKPTDVQAILGHETVDMTLNIYTHMTDKGQSRVSNALNSLNF